MTDILYLITIILIVASILNLSIRITRVEQDVPALIAEVRRLRAELDLARVRREILPR
jgi:hypothetical protein